MPEKIPWWNLMKIIDEHYRDLKINNIHNGKPVE